MLAYNEFVSMARELSSGESGWELADRSSPFGGGVTYLMGRVLYPPIRHRVDGIQPTPTVSAIQWDDDDEDIAATGLPQHTATDIVAEVTFYLCYSEAYQVPQLYFTGQLKKEVEGKGTVRTSITCSDDWNALVFGGLCETGMVVPSTRPIIGSSFCEELGLAAMSLHQCDTAATIQQCRAQNVKDPNTLRVWLRLLASTLQLPDSLLK